MFLFRNGFMELIESHTLLNRSYYEFMAVRLSLNMRCVGPIGIPREHHQKYISVTF